jgi:periplasmic divalent cation tolerance protein
MKAGENLRVVLSTFPDMESARHIGAALVRAQVAACVTLLPSAESIYFWEGKIEHSQEVQAVFKTADFPAFELKLRELHPYDLPEMIALPILEGSPDYLAWMGG